MARKTSAQSPRALVGTLLLLLLTLVLAAALVLAVLYRSENPRLGKQDSLPPLPTQPAVVWPEPVVTADGRSGSLLCLDSYSAPLSASIAAAGRTVASMGSYTLTNAQLQRFYLDTIVTHQRSGAQIQPEASLPLDQQLCPLGDGNLSWQHYFLRQAIQAWKLQTLLLEAAQEPRIIQEEAFKPNETDDLHGKYVAPDLPVNNFLYSDQPRYIPNSMHQAYLDSLDEKLDSLAKELSYADLSDYANTVYGSGITAQELVEAARQYNTAYMFFTEESYDISVSEAEIDGYLSENPAVSQQTGEDTVDIRHLLLIPKDAKTAKDGTVKADEKQWAVCERQAQELVVSVKQEYLSRVMGEDKNFAQLVTKNSADEGSRADGGLYARLHPGQLVEPLDEWCFDEARQAGDCEVIRSPLGIHIVYFLGRNDSAREEARRALTEQKQLERWQRLAEEAEATVNYGSVQLWAQTEAKLISPADVLYPDIAHQRFPEAMVYFQQDYMYSPYGGSYVGRGGCGITTMAMLATYMTDTIYTPAMLAARYPNYHDASGTMGELFRYVPAELGFYLDKTTSVIGDVIEALKQGQRVVSLQHLGHFTSGGHYLLLQQYYADDDTFQVRDSNIYNYGKLSGHKVDYFTRADILSGSATFYIMQKKITVIPACSRCGDQSQPEKLLKEAYLCPKCETALLRRNTFLSLMAE